MLAHLYAERGLGFAEPLRGMFAVAVVDRRRRRVVLVRDRFGIKPLYDRLAGRTLSFASELKALLAQPDVSREPLCATDGAHGSAVSTSILG